MKKITITLLLILPLAYVFAIPEGDKIVASVNCKVTGQVLIESDDGVAKEYSSFDKGLVVGDVFDLKFELEERKNTGYVFNVRSSSADPNNEYMGIAILTALVDEELSESNTELVRWKDVQGNHSLANDEFNFEGIFSDVSGQRYYKNDWHIMVSNNPYITRTAHVLTANCMNMPSTFDDIYNKLKAHHSK